MCMTRLSFELNEHLAVLARNGDVPVGSHGFRKGGPIFVLLYGRERHEVQQSAVRAYVGALRGGFTGRHDALV